MACFYLNTAHTKVSIPSYSTQDGVEYFLIKVNCWYEKEWTVSHRYKSFAELHTSLQKELALHKDELPAKRLIKDVKFLETRRQDLEKYLQKIITTVHQLPVIPQCLLKFLDFHKYDIVFLHQAMAADISQKQIRASTFTVLELHAISEQLWMPSFPCDNATHDFSNILDYCSTLEALEIVPEKGYFDSKEELLLRLISPIGTSNILPSTLTFELKPFTSLRSLSYIGIAPQNISKCDTVRNTVSSLVVNFTRAQNVQQILLPEFIHDSSTNNDSITSQVLQAHPWPLLKKVDLSSNDIWTIDATMKLAPNAEEVNFSENRLRTVTNLSSLHHLSSLNLSGNLIESLVDWHYQLGNIESLNLSCNKIKSLAGLSRLRSLKLLDLSFNQIDSFDEIDELSKLPVVENVALNGNPLMLEVDYRARVLTRFEERCAEIILDNERCSQMEIDKAMVLSALRKTKLS